MIDPGPRLFQSLLQRNFILPGKRAANLAAVEEISRILAEAFFNAGSKGGWVWDNLRIRGTALGHKVSYMHVKGHGEIQRKWIQSDDLIVGHHAQVESESVAYKGKDRIIAMIPGNLILDD